MEIPVDEQGNEVTDPAQFQGVTHRLVIAHSQVVAEQNRTRQRK
jgi:hypothetical protein